MLGSIEDVLNVVTPEDLHKEFILFERGVREQLTELVTILENDIHDPNDPAGSENRAIFVNRFRPRVSLYFSIATAAYRKAQGFSMTIMRMPDKIKYADGSEGSFKITRETREAWEKDLSGPWEGIKNYLENTLDGIDSDVNLAKKIMDKYQFRAGRTQVFDHASN